RQFGGALGGAQSAAGKHMARPHAEPQTAPTRQRRAGGKDGAHRLGLDGEGWSLQSFVRDGGLSPISRTGAGKRRVEDRTESMAQRLEDGIGKTSRGTLRSKARVC